MEDLEFKLEKEKLKEIIEKFKQTIEYYNLRAQAVPKLYKGNDIMIENFIIMYDEKMHKMYKTINSPYFARVDFKRENEKTAEKLYIGKIGVVDEENNIITVDWRAPVASIYYDSNIGKTQYLAPEGVCKGELLLKRQYNIENQKLISFQDVDTVANDELLKPYLNSNADNRLKNIVSTIQKEQNDIIRKPISNNLIIQGVAGSGKTTVALHRIAYLVYNNIDTIKPNQYLVIGPNKFFINYISSVLPDLDVENVNQLTLDELASDYINEKFTIINEEEKLIKYIENPKSMEFEKIKTSMTFKRAIDKYIQEIEDKIIPNKDIELKGYKIIGAEYIKDIYKSQSNRIYDTLEKKINMTELLIIKYLEDNNEEVKKEFKARVHKYMTNLIPNVYKSYIQFITNINNYLDIKNNIDQTIINNNIKNLKDKKLELEDLSALIYLKYRINGEGDFKNYKHIAIDEAQDFGEFNFYTLKCLFNNSTFSIFGDLAQSIYEYRGINKWENVVQTSFKNCQIQELHKSYRTTTEIMNTANNITKYLNLNIAEPVIRHGEKVDFQKFKDFDEQISFIEKYIDEYKSKEYKSIAIITKDKVEANSIFKRLNKKYNAVNITDSDTSYNGKICIVPSHLSKGLEFDGVIITNAGEARYDSNKEIEMKLLYVSMTRPLHKLKILYKDKLTAPLQNYYNPILTI